MPHAITHIHAIGPSGTFSQQAAQQLANFLTKTQQSTPSIKLLATMHEVAARTAQDSSSLGILPIENSQTGTVEPAQNSMISHPLQIVWELNLTVQYSLMAHAPLDQLVRVYVHPAAWEQCSLFVNQHLSQAMVRFTNSNIEAGESLLKQPAQQPFAAIVPQSFAAAHPQLQRAKNIQDHPQNATRFLGLQQEKTTNQRNFSQKKTALLVSPQEDRPGLLYDILSIFKQHNINLCRLESRPSRLQPWTYIFFIDFYNNPHSAQALKSLQLDSNQIRILGSFDQIPTADT